jgi:predicted RecA/RadA family phage recombinase
MAKNFVCTGTQMAFVAPAGGVVSGKPIKMGSLTVVPLETAAAGSDFTGALSGVWTLPCDTALTTVGTAVKWDGAKLVADTTKDADDFGKLVSSGVSGFADALIVQ